MKIKILGTRGEIKSSLPKYSKHSGILIDDELLLDIGEKEFLKYKPSFIFVTHIHPDHAFFLNQKKQGEKIDATIYAPEKLEKNFKIKVLKKAFKINKYRIIPIPTLHSVRVKSQGYIVSNGIKKIFYTGDMVSIRKKYFNLLKNLDLVITEASFIRKGGMIRKSKDGKIFGHAGIPDLLSFFRNFTKEILLIHFGSWFYRNPCVASDKLTKMGIEYNLKIEVGHDGMLINI